ncbi:VOC family protein [Arsenophonus sp.]|uniref:VOC family protein n=1 Tax=Arsenophonus sp. TaxID=1872640 RepID=UPI002854BD83|nr:VOC family protein [Arsenophonus sp.]MDR5615231.1 VOC family protein [Arsenophonus sp.]
MFNIIGLGHINIVVDDLEAAILYYKKLFSAKQVQIFPHFKNIGFAKSAGFMDSPEEVDVSITFLEIPNTSIHIELMQYHSPVGTETDKKNKFSNNIGGIGHICLKINNIDEAFTHIKNMPDTKLIVNNENYQPYKIDNITPSEFQFIDIETENNKDAKENVCKIVSNIRYFYFIDKYGIEWEFEQGHTDIGQ